MVHGLPRGGLERGVVNLVNLLPNSDFVQAICCLDRRGEMADQILGNIEIFELHRGRHDVKLPLRLMNVIRAWHPDIVHCRNWNAWPDTALASSAARLAGHKHSLVWSFHGFAEGERMPLRRRLASQLLAARTDHLAAVCRDAGMRYAQQTGLSFNRFEILYNGVNCQNFESRENRQALREWLGIGPKKLLAITVASLTSIKNHLGLLDAAARLFQTSSGELHFLFVGEGSMRPEIESKIRRLNLTQHVTVLGASDRVTDYLSASDIFVLPSLLEGMSNAILEAMAAGLPVICHGVGGNPELVIHGKTGLLCSLEDSDQLTAALRYLAEDATARIRMGAAARERAVSEFSVEAMMESYGEFYRRIARRIGR